MSHPPEPLALQTLAAAGRGLSYVIAGEAGAPQLDALAAQHRVAAIDLPGHGAGQRPDAPTRIVDTADQVGALMAQEGNERAHLVGVSLGSLVAQDIAARFPRAVRSLTGGGGYPSFGASTPVQRAQTVALLRLVPLLICSLDRFRRAVAREAARTPQARELFIRSAQGFTRSSLRSFAGEQERPLLRSVAEDWQRREPGSVLEVIPGAGHCANMDSPGAFNERLLAFLGRHAQAAPAGQVRPRAAAIPEVA